MTAINAFAGTTGSLAVYTFSSITNLGFAFTSDGSVVASGVAYDILASAQICGGRMGLASSLSNPGDLMWVEMGVYSNSLDCTTIVGAPAGYVVTTTVPSLSTEAGFDIVYLYDNGPLSTGYSAAVLASGSGTVSSQGEGRRRTAPT